jgi:hypothetical protein
MCAQDVEQAIINHVKDVVECMYLAAACGRSLDLHSLLSSTSCRFEYLLPRTKNDREKHSENNVFNKRVDSGGSGAC